MRTASAWGPPPSRYYNFLRMLTGSNHRPREYSLCVLGCADGKFVLPAARRGLKVLAIDRDDIALFGGAKPGKDGPVLIDGLVGRLKREGLTQHVTVQCADFLNIRARRSRAVWVSGAIQYSFNMPKTAGEILSKIMAYVAPAGLLYIDYMLPYEEKYVGRPNCPDAPWWRDWLGELGGWSVRHHRVLRPTIDRAHIEFPTDHYHQWGHVLLERRA